MKLKIILLLFSLFFSACGKSDEEKKQESDILRQNMTTKKQIDSLNIDNVLVTVQSGIKEMDSFLKANAAETQGHTIDPLKSSELRLSSAKENFDSWFSGLPKYDVEADHEESMLFLNSVSGQVNQHKAEFEMAIDEANINIKNEKTYKKEMIKDIEQKKAAALKAKKKKNTKKAAVKKSTAKKSTAKKVPVKKSTKKASTKKKVQAKKTTKKAVPKKN